MERIAVVEVDLGVGRVYEHGWQSCSPSSDQPVTGRGHGPSSPESQATSCRPGVERPSTGFQGEGLLAVVPKPGTTHVFATTRPDLIPSIRATLTGTTLVVEADGPVEHVVIERPLYDALGVWAESFAAKPAVIRASPTAWSSWHEYGAAVTDTDVRENVEGIAKYELPVDVIQIDDGWQSNIGDWLRPSTRFDRYSSFHFHGHRLIQSSLEGLTGITDFIRMSGYRPGIWVAPFIAGADSAVLRRHPDWAGASIGNGWNQELFALDLANADVRSHLVEVFGELAQYFDYFKLDYLFAGALSGLSLYREALSEIRAAVGDAYLVGSRAPILPSVGLVDAMRVGPDVAPHYEPLAADDLAGASQRSAALTTEARAWQHGRFWVNAADSLIAHPSVERRADWADVVAQYGGHRTSSDNIQALDGWGLEITRTLLGSVPAPVPFGSDSYPPVPSVVVTGPTGVVTPVVLATAPPDGLEGLPTPA
ncbi:glycoside hydrolase family 36 protein [Kribbella sp. NPDC056861]|uniref:glycoside hydrolase family 36 protein n=1 Tax=Kribbella sp. NPDC056861 TaxID=3154857 RepID=UPI003412548B